MERFKDSRIDQSKRNSGIRPFFKPINTLLATVTIHCISGLGADQRLFQKLYIPGAELKAVPWPYIDRHDEMACYAQKVAALIPKGPDNVVLGLSFGGMLAAEIARVRPTQKVIIVSSAKAPAELHMPGNFLQFIIHKRLLPVGLAVLGGRRVTERFGARTDEEHQLIGSVLEDTNPHFARCAFRAMIDWQSQVPPPESLVHIHGTADQIIQPDRIHPTHWISDGSHIMIYNRPDVVSALIEKHLI